MALMSKAKLIALIEQSFADTVYPSDENISTFCAPDCDEVALAFRGKHWKDLTDLEFLSRAYSLGALTFFDDVAFRFYLPAFLIASVNDEEIASGLDFYLLPHEAEIKKLKRLVGFSPDQKRAIKAYLQYIYEIDDSSQELAFPNDLQFWDTFED